MRRLHVCTIFEHAKNVNWRPSLCGIAVGDQIIIKEMYRSGEGKRLEVIHKTISEVRELILAAAKRDIPIVISDFKKHIQAFDLPLNVPYRVYDLHLPEITTGVKRSDITSLTRILEQMRTQKSHAYQKLIADAAVVYEDLQKTGLVVGYEHVYPIYSQRTFSGRSKTTGFNIQGLSDNFSVWSPQYPEHNLLIYFDWVCADIRVASLLSGDQKLASTFEQSDPYTAMMEEINAESEVKIGRDEAKLFLLKSINSMDFSSDALYAVYPGLGRWIMRCKEQLNGPDGYLQTLLGRKFRVLRAKNQLAVLNGAMQGSVAHAMQNVIRRIWDRLGTRLLTEIHDSLVVSSSKRAIGDTIEAVVDVMTHPFRGLLEDDPVFPVKVSIGKVWKKWKLFKIYRNA